jgi:hypothetical protein
MGAGRRGASCWGQNGSALQSPAPATMLASSESCDYPQSSEEGVVRLRVSYLGRLLGRRARLLAFREGLHPILQTPQMFSLFQRSVRAISICASRMHVLIGSFEYILFSHPSIIITITYYQFNLNFCDAASPAGSGNVTAEQRVF